MDKERTKWNLLSEPSCTHNRGFLQPNPNGALQTHIDSRSQRYSPRERVQFLYTTHLDQCRRKQGRWGELCGTQLEDEGIKTGPSRTAANFPVKYSTIKMKSFLKETTAQDWRTKGLCMLGKWPDDWLRNAWNQTSVKDCTWQTLCGELMRSLAMPQHNKFNEAIKIIRNGLAC